MARTKGAGSALRNNKIVFGLIFVLVIVVFMGSLTLLRSVYQTETYYVLNVDVPTRTQITPDMLSPITTSIDSSPKAALSLSEVQAGYLYSKYPLSQGDILTDSNVGGFEDIGVGVPDSWVITSFGVNADNAVGGRIKRGYYFDMLVATPDGSYYPFVNILTLDTSISLDNASSAEAADGEEAKSGQTSQYVVGMPPGDAATLHHIMKTSGGDVKLLLSPRQNEYAPPALASYAGTFTFEGGKTKNMGEGTDYTFTPPERDKFGRPISQVDTCSAGNAKINAEDCKGVEKPSTPTEPEETTETTENGNTTTTEKTNTSTTEKKEPSGD